ncbi:MAG: hypothetical protein ACP5UN_03470 [Candidatus Micrarchaeia archaeon]
MNVNKLFNQTKLIGIFKLLLASMMFLSIFATPASADSLPPANNVLCQMVNVYNTVDTAIFIIGLMLMLLGGALYAGAHIMPGQSKGILQGYGMGMILGGVVGVIIAVLLPYLFQLITGQNGSYYTGKVAGC